MIIGSISENLKLEKRVAITPDIVKKYKSLGFEIYLTKDYASHIGIKDEEYETEGANIKSIDEVLANANAILQMNILNDESLNKLKKDQILVGVLNPYVNEKKLKPSSNNLTINKTNETSNYLNKWIEDNAEKITKELIKEEVKKIFK